MPGIALSILLFLIPFNFLNLGVDAVTILSLQMRQLRQKVVVHSQAGITSESN